ncbi:CDKN2AIP N-terminal-like protein [Ambystoma mexicanum]|uniref:CDKN2AIP N-terminal-like protein n=1 Tax=Ambystoma mexicanum TaxID=8296 RepID=UPI0037E70EFE
MVEEFVKDNRNITKYLEAFQSYSESDKQWKARMEFLLRNLESFPDPEEVDHLLALSMVWANHIFMGCRYSDELLDRVTSMAEGIVVKDAPHFTTRDSVMKQQH